LVWLALKPVLVESEVQPHRDRRTRKCGSEKSLRKKRIQIRLTGADNILSTCNVYTCLIIKFKIANASWNYDDERKICFCWLPRHTVHHNVAENKYVPKISTV